MPPFACFHPISGRCTTQFQQQQMIRCNLSFPYPTSVADPICGSVQVSPPPPLLLLLLSRPLYLKLRQLQLQFLRQLRLQLHQVPAPDPGPVPSPAAPSIAPSSTAAVASITSSISAKHSNNTTLSATTVGISAAAQGISKRRALTNLNSSLFPTIITRPIQRSFPSPVFAPAVTVGNVSLNLEIDKNFKKSNILLKL